MEPDDLRAAERRRCAQARDAIAGVDAHPRTVPGAAREAALARQADIIGYFNGVFGRYPFTSAGAIIDDDEDAGYALETQTRPVYALDFFTDAVNGDAVVVHELAHQWFGDSVSVRRWRHIWLNEGFATYAEWLWSARQGRETPQDWFDLYYSSIPADSPFWDVTIGDPGPQDVLELPVYYRGAMTLQRSATRPRSCAPYTWTSPPPTLLGRLLSRKMPRTSVSERGSSKKNGFEIGLMKRSKQ